MRSRQFVSIFLFTLLTFISLSGCRTRSDAFVIALSDNLSTLDPVGSSTVAAADEHVRVLMFNSLIRKNEKFEYVGDLVTNADTARAEDGLSYIFTLHDNVTFHDGRPFTSADAKYTLDTLLFADLPARPAKAASFFKGTGNGRQCYITNVEAPDPRTLVIRLREPWLQLYPNLVSIGIVPKDSAPTQKDHPLGTGPFKFVKFDLSQQILDLAANPTYWEGAPKINNLRVRVIGDANALQAELRSGHVDIAPLPTNLSPDSIKALSGDPNLNVQQFTGGNITHLTFNTQSAPLNDARVRQAIAYAIDRESIVRDLLLGQAKVANSILPEDSWAYSAGQKYSYDPAHAKQLLDEAGFRDPDGDGPQMRFPKPIVYKVSSANMQVRQYAVVMQNSLKGVGIPLEIETAEFNTMRDQLLKGQFQMTTGQWVGGNQDPIFFNDLFATSEIPTSDRASKNRGRYSNKELDPLLLEAINTLDRQKGLSLYTKIQDIVSRDVPLLPLWYPANMVVARKRVGNIKVRADGDWGFVRELTVQ
jgi:peptide/nickel transport system substrate-binding protein